MDGQRKIGEKKESSEMIMETGEMTTVMTMETTGVTITVPVT